MDYNPFLKPQNLHGWDEIKIQHPAHCVPLDTNKKGEYIPATKKTLDTIKKQLKKEELERKMKAQAEGKTVKWKPFAERFENKEKK